MPEMISRKEFLKSFGRCGILIIFTSITGLLASRRSIRRDRSLCSAGRTCRLCRRLDGCSYPEAIRLREKMKHKIDKQNTQDIYKDGKQVRFDEAKCLGCGVCVDICNKGARTMEAAPDRGVPLEISNLIIEMENSNHAL